MGSLPLEPQQELLLIPFGQVRRLMLRLVKRQGHTPRKWRSWDLNGCPSDPMVCLLDEAVLSPQRHLTGGLLIGLPSLFCPSIRWSLQSSTPGPCSLQSYPMLGSPQGHNQSLPSRAERGPGHLGRGVDRTQKRSGLCPETRQTPAIFTACEGLGGGTELRTEGLRAGDPRSEGGAGGPRQRMTWGCFGESETWC